MSRSNGHTLVAAAKYMIMSLVGSGLLLIGIAILYDVTGHLLMVDIHRRVEVLSRTGNYQLPLTVAMGLISVGLAIKSALFPFHSWLPDAYSYSTPSSSAILSSLVSKGYIFLLFKVFYRVFGFEFILDHKVTNILFFFGVAGMIAGSVMAIYQTDMRRLIAFSSVAQIGYIYMGIGLSVSMGTGIVGCVGRQQRVFRVKRCWLPKSSRWDRVFGRRIFYGRNPIACWIYIESIFC